MQDVLLEQVLPVHVCVVAAPFVYDVSSFQI